MDMAKLSCHVGLHQWSPWAIKETSLVAADGKDLDELRDIRIEDQERWCRRKGCEKKEVRTLLVW